jgi:hypothetical protein
MTKKKIVKEKELDREEFLDIIRSQMDEANEAIKEARHHIASYIDLYQKIEIDKCKYNLKYFITEGGLAYERTRRKKIGF